MKTYIVDVHIDGESGAAGGSREEDCFDFFFLTTTLCFSKKRVSCARAYMKIIMPILNFQQRGFIYVIRVELVFIFYEK